MSSWLNTSLPGGEAIGASDASRLILRLRRPKTPLSRGPNGRANCFFICAAERGAAMARKCPVTGKGVQVGHNVSHSNIKSKRRFLPNLQTISLLSDVLGPVRLRLSTAGIRTIEKNGGIDAFLRGSPDSRLSPEIRRLKRRVLTAAAAREAS
jgi:large subunit ribosomal protein L28